MTTWEESILNQDANVDFLEDLQDLENEEILEAIHDACVLARDTEDEQSEDAINGLAAATIVAIWAGAPYSAGDVIDEYPFIRANIGHDDEDLHEIAGELLENVETDYDIEAFIEALT